MLSDWVTMPQDQNAGNHASICVCIVSRVRFYARHVYASLLAACTLLCLQACGSLPGRLTTACLKLYEFCFKSYSSLVHL